MELHLFCIEPSIFSSTIILDTEITQLRITEFCSWKTSVRLSDIVYTIAVDDVNTMRNGINNLDIEHVYKKDNTWIVKQNEYIFHGEHWST